MTSRPIKAVLPIAGLGTRFLPLSKVFPKELWPLLNRPVLDYIVQELKDSGAKEIIFVNSPGKKIVENYFKTDSRIERALEKRGKKDVLAEFKKNQNNFCDLKFSSVIQKKPLGDGHAVLQAKKKIGRNPFMVSFCDDVVISKTACLKQMMKVFIKYNRPVIAIKRIAPGKVSSYGAFKVKKIAPRIYQLKGIVEKPKLGQAPSNFVFVGKCIFTPDIFTYLEKAKPVFRGEILLANAFEQMIRDGKMIYGYEFEGKWLECGNINGWLKSNLYLSRLQKL